MTCFNSKRAGAGEPVPTRTLETRRGNASGIDPSKHVGGGNRVTFLTCSFSLPLSLVDTPQIHVATLATLHCVQSD